MKTRILIWGFRFKFYWRRWRGETPAQAAFNALRSMGFDPIESLKERTSDQPIKRLVYKAGVSRYCKSFVSFWDRGSILWRRSFGSVWTVTATVDCSTTGGALFFVDPKEVLRLKS